ncbi:hypothetical protein NQ317_015992, partial [Molorchus minor]
RRQSHEAGSAKRRSIEPTKKIFHDRSKSTPHQSKKSVHASPRAKSVVGFPFDESKFKCSMCRNRYLDPRVLPCLHTFCLRCLHELERRAFTTWYDEELGGQRTNTTDSRKASSGGSGYASDKHDEGPTKRIFCPTCGSLADMPPGGISSFPPNYPLQHRMVLATLNSHSTHLLCDLCTSDTSAISRCMECAISFCNHCEELHLRQKSSADHEVLSLDEAREKGITKVRKQIMCMRHPDLELSIFCSSCYQVICRDCVSVSHKGHTCEPVSRAAKSHLSRLRLAAERAKSVVEETAVAASRLNSTSKKIEARCNKVQTEVEKFIDDYIKSIEEHKFQLLEQIRQVREEKLKTISQEKLKLQRRIKDARDIAFFLDDLLNDGTDVEVLSFLNPVMDKIEKCDNFKPIKDLQCSESLQFLPEEAVKCQNNFYMMYGALTTQSVSPKHCHMNIEDLQNLRVGKKAEACLETRDSKDAPLDRGGESVTAEIRHREAGVSRSLVVDVLDNRNGTYTISFVPDVAGKLLLSINIKGSPINGSPFPIIVRSTKHHHGTFHCCSFCSSGGSKEASCGCGGKMPGGYKGCGHGHEGHPGRRHWSCCGNILEHSECSKSNSQYQFTL